MIEQFNPIRQIKSLMIMLILKRKTHYIHNLWPKDKKSDLVLLNESLEKFEIIIFKIFKSLI